MADNTPTATTVRNANRSELARITGISLSGVSRILSGKRNPTSHNLAMIAEALNLEMGELYRYLRICKQRLRRKTQAAA